MDATAPAPSLPDSGDILSDPRARPSWSSLKPAAKAFRIAHTMWSVVSIACLGYIWRCAVTGRRNRMLAGSIGFLLVEGGALVVGRGDCPCGPMQRQLGDPVPLFELVLPPRAAKAAIPALLIVTLAGLAAIATRMLRDVVRGRAAPSVRVHPARSG